MSRLAAAVFTLFAGLPVDHRPAGRTVCGDDDLIPVNSYAGSLGPDVAFVRLHKFAVGALEQAPYDDAVKYCTGALIAPDLFLTAAHCVDGSTVGQAVAFDYEWTPSGHDLLPQSHYRVDALVERGDEDRDYAVLRLAGNPGFRQGWETVRTEEPRLYDLVTAIQHPLGEPKQVEAGHVSAFRGNYMEYGDLDTQPGSSGAVLLDRRGVIVGVHSDGGCDAAGGTNIGLRMSALAQSPVLARLTAIKLPMGEGSRVLLRTHDHQAVLAGDAPTGKVWLEAGGCRWDEASLWTVRDLGDGSFALMKGDAALRARSDTGAIDVSAAPGPGGAQDLAARWRFLPLGDGRMALRVVSTLDGPHWLGADSAGMGVRLGRDAAFWDVEIPPAGARRAEFACLFPLPY